MSTSAHQSLPHDSTQERVIPHPNERFTHQQYLTRIKTIVDNISASGSQIDPEDIMLNIMNGLPPTFNSFKSTIRNSLLPIDLDTFYSLLCNEEIHLQQELHEDPSPNTTATALYASSNTTSRNRNNSNTKRFSKTKNPQTSSNPPAYMINPPTSQNSARPTCQICGKTGHTALNCWHRCNLKYAPTNSRPPRALLANPSTTTNQDWILDSGASAHLTPDASQLYYPTAYHGSDTVSTANGSMIPIHTTGQGILPLPDTARKLHLHNLLHVPSLTHNLLSVSKLTADNSISITFDANGFIMKDRRDQHPLLLGQLHNRLYRIRIPPDIRHTALTSTTSSNHQWHSRLSHPSKESLAVLTRQFPNLARVILSFICESCNLAKSRKIVFNKSTYVTTAPFDLIHSDLWDPASQNSINGYRYYNIFIDDFTRFSWLYFLYSKQEALSTFKFFCNMVRTQYHTTPKILRSDGGGEYTSQAFKSYLQDHGILQQLSCPHTPEQNGLAERKHRHLLDHTRAILHESGLPHKFRAEAISTAHYLINKLPSKAISNQIPTQRLHGTPPDYNHLRTFGCLCYPWLRPYAPDKLSTRSAACVFIGYSPTHKGYKCYNLTTGKTHISRHVVFHEQHFPYKHANTDPSTSPVPSNNRIPPPLLIPASATSPPHVQNPIKPIPQPSAVSTTPSPTPHAELPDALPVPPPPIHSLQPTPASSQTHQMLTRSKSGIHKPKQIFNLLTQTTIPSTPTTYNQAMKTEHWRKAMTTEFEALIHQATWSLVPPPPNKLVLGCKWIFKTKMLPNGQIDRYKARLVALGYDQKFGINYTKTFSPVAKMPTIRLLKTLALHRKWPLYQLDISNAFLHGDLPDDIYMRQPPSFIDPQNPTAVCKLHKSLYGLKQAPRQWFQKLTSFLQSQGFTFSRSDPSLLLNTVQTQLYILIYVDDFLVTGNDLAAIQRLLLQLQS
ncbi:hypothetical protein KFK09_005432 [Dendrobium nobile]|uniref:Retrovirus-related Pol polyprotein from transposon TNT 1-94 n=1 Tax=Dendrobium nobile TaxID=94219 RepID=A0A8T3BY95_DENNO|nr:hypothetical protein KFK09_005432 [Dendrobium nobile]